MEIQDRNNLLQNILGLRDFGSAAPDLKGMDFVDVLKAQPKPEPEKTENSVDAKIVFAKNEYVKPEIQQKKDVAVNDEIEAKDKNPVKEEKVASKPDTAEKTKETDKPDEEKAVAVNQSQDAVQEEKTVETDSVADSVDDSVATEVNPVNQESLEEMPVYADVAKMLFDAAGAEGEETSTPSFTAPVETDASVVVEENVEKTLTQEEAAVLKQAKLLDEKVGTDKKLKIEVDVKEEKIAAIPTKEVLQNPLEVDSLIKHIDASAKKEDIFAEALSEEILSPDVDAEVQPQTKAFPEMSVPTKNDIVAFAEVNVAAESVKQASSDASVLSLSGKEAVFETANISRNDSFSRINDTSVREPFKGLGKEVVEQIKVNITKSAVKGVDTIDIQLKPEDLGKVQVKMQISKDGKLQADIIVSRQETMDMLQKEISSLTKAFNDAGFDADGRSFNFSFQEDNQAQKQHDDGSFSNFIGNSLEQEAEQLAEDANFGYDPLYGLNIKV